MQKQRTAERNIVVVATDTDPYAYDEKISRKLKWGWGAGGFQNTPDGKKRKTVCKNKEQRGFATEDDSS